MFDHLGKVRKAFVDSTYEIVEKAGRCIGSWLTQHPRLHFFRETQYEVSILLQMRNDLKSSDTSLVAYHSD